MSNVNIQVHIREETNVTHQVLTVRDTNEIFATVNIGAATMYFDTVEQIELVRAELQKAEEALAKANMAQLANDINE